MSLPHCIFKSWVHSHEEDTEDTTVYRPASYSFPLSRGRREFELKENGQVDYYGIGPADVSRVAHGRWTVEGTRRVRIEFDDGNMESRWLEIISCSDEMLKVKQS